ncbi:uncharacterized protein BDZ99DRAFT_56983 [Mytilinidion resinicola]|uniref:Uncharacterized protein n=1 Tax=Mytilinidion resinicola TaxID=574789 RepID=A0A6A6YI77_9PEZI|nr:uncharacterized protein BDZ99DRAFT_56983 [Mytilinidion resinicola]KAF2808501.1 hypothetical protein BDZ99DRAFT_56983 [Mytilinidion resinicola]
MQFTLAALAALLTLAAALPTESKRATPGGVKFCTGENSTSDCEYAVYDYNTCHTLAAPYYKNVGSIVVDSGAFCRITYTAESCTLHGDAFINPPGEATLHHFTDAEGVVVDAGAAITSFLCQECTSCV